MKTVRRRRVVTPIDRLPVKTAGNFMEFCRQYRGIEGEVHAAHLDLRHVASDRYSDKILRQVSIQQRMEGPDGIGPIVALRRFFLDLIEHVGLDVLLSEEQYESKAIFDNDIIDSFTANAPYGERYSSFYHINPIFAFSEKRLILLTSMITVADVLSPDGTMFVEKKDGTLIYPWEMFTHVLPKLKAFPISSVYKRILWLIEEFKARQGGWPF